MYFAVLFLSAVSCMPDQSTRQTIPKPDSATISQNFLDLDRFNGFAFTPGYTLPFKYRVIGSYSFEYRPGQQYLYATNVVTNYDMTVSTNYVTNIYNLPISGSQFNRLMDKAVSNLRSRYLADGIILFKVALRTLNSRGDAEINYPQRLEVSGYPVRNTEK